MSDLKIGKKILECRKKKNVTQEDLANFIGVSKASVSKWETGQSYPDISFLPLLAAYFSITVDELIAYEPQMPAKEIKKHYLKLAKEFSEKPFEEVIEKAEKLVKKYFACYELLFQIALLYLNNFHLAADAARSAEVLKRAENLFAKVKLECRDQVLQRAAQRLQAFCLIQLNQPHEALALLPLDCGQTISSEILAARAYQMTGREHDAKKTLQIAVYQDLINLLQLLQAYLPFYAGDAAKLEEIAKRYDSAVTAFKLKNLRPDLCAAFKLQLAGAYMQMPGQEKAAKAAPKQEGEQAVPAKAAAEKEALRLLEEYKNIVTRPEFFPIELKGDEFFDVIEECFEEFVIGKQAPRDEKLIKESLYAAVAENPAFADLKDKPQFQKILKEIKESW